MCNTNVNWVSCDTGHAVATVLRHKRWQREGIAALSGPHSVAEMSIFGDEFQTNAKRVVDSLGENRSPRSQSCDWVFAWRRWLGDPPRNSGGWDSRRPIQAYACQANLKRT